VTMIPQKTQSTLPSLQIRNKPRPQHALQPDERIKLHFIPGTCGNLLEPLEGWMAPTARELGGDDKSRDLSPHQPRQNKPAAAGKRWVIGAYVQGQVPASHGSAHGASKGRVAASA
jgi:hypothetical protein